MARFLLISTMKNEGAYVLEWVAWHRLIGFDDVLVYTNDCEDGTDALLDRLTALGLVRHERNEVLKRGPHKSALKWAFAHALTGAADWIFIADADEFLEVRHGDGSARALVEACPGADCIPVTWRLFSHAGEAAFRDGPVTETFLDAERPLEDGGFPDRFVKSLFRRPEALLRFGLHGPRPKPGEDYAWMQPDGRRLGPRDNLTRPARRFGYEGAEVRHYAVRAIDDFLVKRDRGRANHVDHVLGAEYWLKMSRGGAAAEPLPRAAALRAEVGRLKADPELGRLHAAAVEWRRAKVADLLARPDFAKLRADLLAFAAAGAHLRRRGEPAPEAGPLPRIAALLGELRGLVQAVEPREAAMQAAGRIDEIERGLFGAPRRG